MNKIKQSRQAMEIVFCLLRWLFFLMGNGLFFYLYASGTMEYKTNYYVYLSAFAFVYMLFSHVVLVKAPQTSKLYLWATKGGVGFDYIAFLAVVFLTGGIGSMFYPTAFLIIMHVTVYWGLAGGIVSSFLLAGGYSAIAAIDGAFSDTAQLVLLSFHVVYLGLIGFLGGLTVSRERALLAQSRRLEKLASVDSLTGLNNHRVFQETAASYFRSKTPFFLVMADVDYFKSINDTYGHRTGDFVLQYIAEVIQATIDGKNAAAYRYGGEEFAFLFKGSDEHYVYGVLHELRQKFEDLPYTEGNALQIRVTMSFGVAFADPNISAWDELLSRADQCLYEAKRSGRNRTVFHQQ
ncbi:MAG TPA: GGDEF domain-containing protein [Bacillales bacterium]|nr:GGDEF domain-containing protein [Bacillales bacterium]